MAKVLRKFGVSIRSSYTQMGKQGHQLHTTQWASMTKSQKLSEANITKCELDRNRMRSHRST